MTDTTPTFPIVMAFQPHDEAGNPTGASVTLENVSFAPLPFEQLVGAKLGDKVTIRLNWRNAKVVQSSFEGVNVEQIASGNATLESHFSSRTIGLVPGGWIPPSLACQADLIVLPDRCTVSEIRARFQRGAKTREADLDFLDFFAGQRMRLNPVLFALEGNRRREPSSEEVTQQLAEAIAHLQRALPQAEVIGADGGTLSGVIGLLQESALGMEAKRAFLMQVAERLHAPVRAERRGALWDGILRAASECGVEQKSLVVIAALSSLAAPMACNPAKAVLKLQASYTPELAYNALADLRALELLMALFARFPTQPTMLCTGDKNLALLWAGLRASNLSWMDGHTAYTLAPVDSLFSGIDSVRFDQYFDHEP